MINHSRDRAQRNSMLVPKNDDFGQSNELSFDKIALMNLSKRILPIALSNLLAVVVLAIG